MRGDCTSSVGCLSKVKRADTGSLTQAKKQVTLLRRAWDRWLGQELSQVIELVPEVLQALRLRPLFSRNLWRSLKKCPSAPGLASGASERSISPSGMLS